MEAEVKDAEQITITLANCEDTLMREIADRKITRDSLSLTYAMSICSDEQKNKAIDWKRVNDAIIHRWSMSALTYIKVKAWKTIREHQEAAK